VSIALLWLLLLIVAVGVPVMALYVDRRAAAVAASGRLPEDDWAFQRRPGLAVAQLDVVERSLRTGAQAPDPGLRPLVAERAHALLSRSWWTGTAETSVGDHHPGCWPPDGSRSLVPGRNSVQTVRRGVPG